MIDTNRTLRHLWAAMGGAPTGRLMMATWKTKGVEGIDSSVGPVNSRGATWSLATHPIVCSQSSIASDS